MCLDLFADGGDFTSNTVEKNRNRYYQQQLANRTRSQTTEILALVTKSLQIHLNHGQARRINSSSVHVSVESVSPGSLSNKVIRSIENTYMRLPSNMTLATGNATSAVLLQSVVQPLAVSDDLRSQANTNLSRSVSLSIVDENGNETAVRTTSDQPIELIIPRDPNLVLPPMTLQNVSLKSSVALNSQTYNLHHVNLGSQASSAALHFEMRPSDASLGYLLIYRFDSSPQLNRSISLIDGWTRFCPSNDSLYTYFLNNQQTSDHKSIVFGLREMIALEMSQFCGSNASINANLPTSNDPFVFSANYALRTYRSSCYYLSASNTWTTDGLVVSGSLSLESSSIVLSGGTTDQSLSNTMLLHAFDHLCGWLHRVASTCELELCLRQCGFRQKQDHLFDGDLHLYSVHLAGDLRSLQGQKRCGESKHRFSCLV